MPSVVAQQRIELGDVNPNNIGQLKKLHAILFPVNYGDKFYEEVLSVGEYAKYVFFNDLCVGSVCCRKEDTPDENGATSIYLMTLGVLEPYRQNGLGRRLLDHILTQARNDGYSNIYLHVQTTNDQAVKFYKHYDFEVVDTVQEYYKDIPNRDAFILQRSITAAEQ